jgi:hypothetical protein
MRVTRRPTWTLAALPFAERLLRLVAAFAAAFPLALRL